ncbi:hypothetical protein LguiB_012199 [Lonicera macranthoides]
MNKAYPSSSSSNNQLYTSQETRISIPSTSILSFPLNFHFKCLTISTLLLSIKKQSLCSSPIRQSIVISLDLPPNSALVVYNLFLYTCSLLKTKDWMILSDFLIWVLVLA